MKEVKCRLDAGNWESSAEVETPGYGDMASKMTDHINSDTFKEDIVAKECANGYLSGFLLPAAPRFPF